MANIHTVFEIILENGVNGKKVQLGVADQNEYETARTRLVKLWNRHKELLISIAGEDCDPLLAFSLCGSYVRGGTPDELPHGIFYLGKPRRKEAKNYSFTVVSEQPAIPDAVNDSTITTAIAK